MLRARRGPFDPFKLTWILTEACSQRCSSCHLWREPASGPDLATVRSVVAANPQLTWVNLSGGDFVERADAPDVVDAVASGFPDLALLDFPTAGQDVDATLAALQPALDSDVPRIVVTVSLDGPDEVHDRVRGSRGSAARARSTLRALQRIRRRGFSALAGMTLSRHNLGEVDDPLALLPRDIAAADLHLNLAHHSDHYYRNAQDVVPNPVAALAVIDAQQRRRGPALSPLAWMEARYWRLARRFVTTGDVGGACAALRASVYLAADMTAYPCTIHDRPIGSLAQVGHELRRLSEFSAAHDALADADQQRCAKCWSPCEAFPTLLVGLGRPR